MKMLKFKNGNINLKLENDDTIKSFYEFLEGLYLQCDFMTYSDTEDVQRNKYCLGNDCIACDMYYNGDPSICYAISSYAYNKIMDGKTIKLYAFKNEEV